MFFSIKASRRDAKRILRTCLNKCVPKHYVCRHAYRRWPSSCRCSYRSRGRWDHSHPRRCTQPSWCSAYDPCYRAPPSSPRRFCSYDVDGHVPPIRVFSLPPLARLCVPAASSDYSSNYPNSVNEMSSFIKKNRNNFTVIIFM